VRPGDLVTTREKHLVSGCALWVLPYDYDVYDNNTMAGWARPNTVGMVLAKVGNSYLFLFGEQLGWNVEMYFVNCEIEP
jgi:hypothetical protein